MMQKLLVVGLAIFAATSALPSSSTPAERWDKMDIVANFDERPGTPAVALKTVGVYEKIFFKGMTSINPFIYQELANLVPETPTNYIGFSEIGVPKFVEGSPGMTVEYEDSQVSSFDLTSFYYGCAVASKETIVVIPFTGVIEVAGFNATGLVDMQTFEFNVGYPWIQAKMKLGTLDPPMKGLTNVTFSVKVKKAPLLDALPLDVLKRLNALLAGAFDKMSYTIYQK